MSKHRTRTTTWDRLLSGILCLALVLGLLPAAGMIQTAWADEAEHWAYPYAEKLLEWGVMKDASDLRLDDQATRAEFVAMCNRAFGYKELGGTPFIDVPYTAWYAQDIDIAYNAGYFKGTSDNMASPEDTLTREQAAVLLARNLMLQETVGEVTAFTDGHALEDWSRGLIGAAAAEHMISGYEDGSFRPANNITRGELAAMLVRAVGNPVGAAGNHELVDVYGNVVINTSGVTLRDTVILGNLYITGGVGLGNVLLENITVLGRIVISGGGESDAAQSSVILRNVKAKELVVDSMIDQFVTISAYGITDIPLTSVRSNAYLEDNCGGAYGLKYIELAGESHTELQLAGEIKEVVNKTPNSLLQLVKGTAETITIDEKARNSQLVVGTDTRVDVLNLDVATLVTGDGIGEGDIIQLNIWANGCEVDILPAKVDIRPGLTAIIAGKVYGSSAASELSSEPRLMAGYPKADSLRPTQAEGMYSGNKPGTIYWAVSEMGSGSVSVEHLIKNPPYGGNIYKNNSGSIDASSRGAEYGRLISSLEPGGSYYISAVMVDERGNRSPLKVVSFTTPDDTRPAFTKEPYMSLISCETAQVTTMANKNCQLYWVLLPHDAAPPTTQNFMSGSFGGDYGHGSQSVVKNVLVSINVNSIRLQEKTDYDLYLWLRDFDGAMSSDVVHVVNKDTNKNSDPTFTTPDETAPVITGLSQIDYGTNDARLQFTVSETPVTLYWFVVTDSNESVIPAGSNMESLETQHKVKSAATAAIGTSSAIVIGGTKTAAGDVQDTYYIEPADFKAALDYGKWGTHAFKFYCVAEDGSKNFSAVRVITIRTLDTDPPHVWLEFTSALNENPRIDSDIKIVFDEEVQGGASAEYTFLELYERVVAYEKLGEGYKTDLTSAKNALAAQLAAHFQLWSTPRGGSAQQVTAKGDNQTNQNWVIDWHQATVKKESGNLIITVPNSGLNLDSGASYQFRLWNVCDLALDHNPIAVGDDGVTCVRTGGKASTSNSSTNSGVLPRLSFTTVYAQVEMRDKTGIVTSIQYQDSTSEKPYKDYRLDIVVDLVPESTEKVPESQVWDLIMWSDNIMQVDVYRKVLKDDGKDGADIPGQDWVKVSKDSASIHFDKVGQGNGLGANKEPKAQYDHVNGNLSDGLKKGFIYRYGIHITYMGNAEEDPKETPPDWDQLVVMRFSVIAGLEGGVNVVSVGVDRYYEEYKAKTDGNAITEIGVSNKNAMQESKIQCEWPFVDSRAPAFRSTYPKFAEETIGSNSFTMEVSLNRRGTIYYAVAPAGVGIDLEIDAKTPINASNDGRDGFDSLTQAEKEAKINGLKDNTYIPLNGSEREAYKNKIYFMNSKSGINLSEELAEYVPGRYNVPDYLDITLERFKKYDGVQTGVYSVEEGGAIDEITLSGLKADTWYYVYIVLEGVGATDYAVQVYRVKTDEAKRPTIRINSDFTSATMTPDSYVQLDYVLVSSTALPSYFNTQITCQDGKSHTVLWAMINSPGGMYGQQTYFDLYDGTNSEELKRNVMNYLLSPNRSSATGVIYAKTKEYNPATAQTVGVFEDFDKILPEYKAGQENVNTYVLLAVAVNYSLVYPTNNAAPTDYAFAAADGLYHQNLAAPELTGVINDCLSVSLTKVTNTTTKRDITAAWGGNTYNDVERKTYMTFTGSVTISFNVPIYQAVRSSNTHKAILTHEYKPDTTCKDHTSETGGINFMELISYSGKSADGFAQKLEMNASFKKYEGAQRSFRLDFENIMDGFEITFLTQGNIMGSNPAGYIFPYEVTLKFDPLITSEELGIGYLEGFLVGGFRVSYRPASQ